MKIVFKLPKNTERLAFLSKSTDSKESFSNVDENWCEYMDRIVSGSLKISSPLDILLSAKT